jgi:hypothetical protein
MQHATTVAEGAGKGYDKLFWQNVDELDDGFRASISVVKSYSFSNQIFKL